MDSQGGRCHFKFDHDVQTDKHMVPNVPGFFLDAIGPDFFNPVERLSFDFAIVDDLSRVAGFPELREINFNIEFGVDVDFSPLADLPNLKTITITELARDVSNTFERDVDELKRLLPNVELILDSPRK